ncbi:MAG: hypothetical protein AVDCRST_MAG79-1435 [uncultured Thermoleophilia bacterium]|uniref:Uncharacterized protein n=1 Tax=uncultured Thermoleophilia bacterium TaxID=1497501 RepID=A0A6J4U0Y5_9ACTN|nr:MAG: hypothetical protein AVDCRST_MAG79-1435 [uncultured Thermoleophilia bacterium]
MRRGAPGGTTRVPLRFAPGAIVAESPALPAGVYDVETAGGRSVLAVNASAEWLPRRPTVRALDGRGGAGPLTELRGIRSLPWAYLLLIVLLAAEWLVRRRLALM